MDAFDARAPSTMGGQAEAGISRGPGLMGQADLLAWLEEHPGWHTVSDVSEAMDREPANVRKILGKLRQHKDVECRVLDGKKGKIYRVNKPRM